MSKYFDFQCYDNIHVTKEKVFTTIWDMSSAVMKEIHSICETLSKARHKLSIETLDRWDEHTTATCSSKNIAREVRRSFNAEMCTNAWIKFFEILYDYQVIPPVLDDDITALFLCEAPGGFIGATNHFIQLWYPDYDFFWKASTLNPQSSKNSSRWLITDSRFLDATWNNWLFGFDGTGNIMDKNNIQHIWENLPKKVNFVTADGSIPCGDRWQEQENTVFPIVFAEVVCALGALSNGGSFILKLFTLFEPSTLCILYILCCSFEKVSVVKPWASKEGNAEVYVVALGFKDIEKSLLEIMLNSIQNIKTAPPLLSPNLIPLSFFKNAIDCSRFYTNINITAIERNLEIYWSINKKEEYEKQQKLQKLVAREFIQRFELDRIPRNRRLVTQMLLDGTGP